MKKMLIASDFDGTLCVRGKVDGETIKAIERWRADGRFFGVVTGRNVDFFDTAKELGIPFDFLILCNGSLILSGDKTILFESLIPPRLFASLEKALKSYDDLISFGESDGSPERQCYALFPSDERALMVKEELLPAFGEHLNIFVNGAWINVGNAGTGKAEGVEFILRHFDLPEGSAAVVGDDLNDLEMILAHDGWAMRSGKPEVLAKAKRSCGSVGELIDALL